MQRSSKLAKTSSKPLLFTEASSENQDLLKTIKPSFVSNPASSQEQDKSIRKIKKCVYREHERPDNSVKQTKKVGIRPESSNKQNSNAKRDSHRLKDLGKRLLDEINEHSKQLQEKHFSCQSLNRQTKTEASEGNSVQDQSIREFEASVKVRPVLCRPSSANSKRQSEHKEALIVHIASNTAPSAGNVLKKVKNVNKGALFGSMQLQKKSFGKVRGSSGCKTVKVPWGIQSIDKRAPLKLTRPDPKELSASFMGISMIPNNSSVVPKQQQTLKDIVEDLGSRVD